MKFAGMLLTFLTLTSVASAAAAAAPEIDGNSLVTGVVLAAGALIVLRGRRK